MGNLVLQWAPPMPLDWYIPRPRQRKEERNYHRYTDWFETFKHYYPHMVYIHKERLDERRGSNANVLKKDIRRWVEQHVNTECMVYVLEKSFRYWTDYHKSKPSYDRPSPWHVNHGYWVFFFEEASEAVNFKLRFADFVEEYRDVPEECSHIPLEDIDYSVNGGKVYPNPEDRLLDIDE